MPPAGPADVRVRPFAAADVPAANALTNHYIQHTAIHFAAQPARDAEFHAVWEPGSKTHPWLAAELEGRVVGYAKAGVWRAREAYRFTAEVGIYVHHERCGRGIGTALYRELFERCRAMGFHTLVAGIALPNEGSVRMHEACGFVYVGTFREVGRKFDQWHDVGWWQRMV